VVLDVGDLIGKVEYGNMSGIVIGNVEPRACRVGQ
jgi:hypothetical protein